MLLLKNGSNIQFGEEVSGVGQIATSLDLTTPTGKCSESIIKAKVIASQRRIIRDDEG